MRFLVLCCASLLATILPAGAADRASFLAPADLRPGQKAIVRTVFQGDRIEEFEAEILGVLESGRAAGGMVLARATSERVIATGIAQGMSGSPVYVDGKLIGALSSGWSFTREPIFGITPIAEMLALLDQPPPSTADATAGPSGAEPAGLATELSFGEFRWDTGEEPFPAATPPAHDHVVAGLRPLMVPVSAAGLSPAVLDYANTLLAPLRLAAVPGGTAPGGGPTKLEPGSAIAVDVMRGDLQLSAIGTVTYVDGGRVLAFGHPFFQSGAVRLPMATAEIVTVVSSQAISFKLGMRGRSVGVLDQDRRAGIAGTLGPEPHLLPLSVSIAGVAPTTQSFRFETIEDRSIAPALVSIATMNSLLESGGSGANQTLRWTLTLHRKQAPPLTLSDVVAGEAPAADLSGAVLAPLRFLFGNPFQRLELDSIGVRVEAEPGRAAWTLRSARLLDASVRPGGVARVQVELERWRGGRELREHSIPVPHELPDGRYLLWLGGGAELARYEAQRLPARYRPVSLDDAWRRLQATRGSTALYLALLARAPEITSEGRDYPELPASALPLLGSAQSGGDRPRRGELANLFELRVPLAGPLRGEVQLPLVVDSRAP